MIPADLLLRAVKEERERELRRRRPRIADVPSGPRHAHHQQPPATTGLQLGPGRAAGAEAS
jgi:hypothetical protein